MVLPRAHESQHHKSGSHRRIVLGVSLGRIPLRHTEYFHEENGEENEQNEPQGEEADNHWQARPKDDQHS
jgi:hypothetical protein